MKIKALEKKFKDEWILAEVLKENKLNEVTEAKPIFHDKNRDKVYDELLKVKKGQHIAILYTGTFPKKGMAYAL